jgi:hypothetical protein
MAGKVFEVRAAWDSDAAVWTATSDDVPGLCAEADNFDALVEAVLELAPILLMENGVNVVGNIAVRVVAERNLTLQPAA